ncbi:MAG: MFS transporter [Ignavibacterium sp.]|nr:MFS transporter [Ignavibacterium sp.]
MKNISRTIWLLSLISLFTDFASEMLYPIMPIFLNSIGFSIVWIGIIEGIAEATAGLSKGFFGMLSDKYSKRVPFVRFGYSLSAISKPLIALFSYPLWIVFARSLDRLGKGIRTGARDAMLSEESTIKTKGTIFGFHRSMDTLGAVLGPLFCLAYLNFYPEDYKTLFFIAFIPGLFAIILTFKLKDKNPSKIRIDFSDNFFSFLDYIKKAPKEYKKLVIGLLIFSLVNSSDFFLILKIKQAGQTDSFIIVIYIFYNLVYAFFAYPIGIISDKIGLKLTYMSGLFLFSIVYFGMSFNFNSTLFFILFLFYGIYIASTEGVSKAWISNIVSKNDVATAIGAYSALQSVCTLIASSLTGLLWFYFGSTITFIVIASVVFLLIFYFIIFTE